MIRFISRMPRRLVAIPIALMAMPSFTVLCQIIWRFSASIRFLDTLGVRNLGMLATLAFLLHNFVVYLS